MVKATGGNNVILGLSDENIRRLRLGQPIKFNMQEIGFPDINIVIITGKDEHSIQKELMETFQLDPTKVVMKDSRKDQN